MLGHRDRTVVIQRSRPAYDYGLILRDTPLARTHRREEPVGMTFIWFVIWLIANNVGGTEPLLLDPVNAWAGTLLLAVALDLGGNHARSSS